MSNTNISESGIKPSGLNLRSGRKRECRPVRESVTLTDQLVFHIMKHTVTGKKEL